MVMVLAVTIMGLAASDVVSRAEHNEVVRKFEAAMARLEQNHAALMTRVKALEQNQHGSEEPVTGASSTTVDPTVDASPAESPVQRRLTAQTSSTHVFLAHSDLVHEFTPSSTCNLGSSPGYKRHLPIDSTGSATFDPSTHVATSTPEFSLVNVGTGWATTEIARVPVPLKLVHDGPGCNANPPSLEIGLNTSVTGTLTVNGRAVPTVPDLSVSTFDAATTETAAALSGTVVDDHADFPGLTHTVTLSSERTAMVMYQVSYEANPAGSFADYAYLVNSL